MTGTCRCGARWGGLKPEHCTECHQTFTGTLAGDAHRKGPHHPRGLRYCVPPETVGLVYNSERQMWGNPVRGEGPKSRRSTKSEAVPGVSGTQVPPDVPAATEHAHAAAEKGQNK